MFGQQPPQQPQQPQIQQHQNQSPFSFSLQPSFSGVTGSQPQQSSPAFSQPQQQGGQPSSSPSFFSFGASSAGAFGGQSSFGQQAQYQPSFGQPSPTSGFGSLQALPSPGGAFGQPQQQPSSGSPFMQQQNTPFQQPSLQMAPQQQQQSPQQPPLAGPSRSTLQPENELQEIYAAFNPDPNNQKYAFRHLFRNVNPDPSQRVKPQGVNELKWRETLEEMGGEDNSDLLWPVQFSGFNELLQRLRQDSEAHKENNNFMNRCQQYVREQQQIREDALRRRVSAVREEHESLKRRLIHVMRILQAVDNAAAPKGPLTREESQLRERINKLNESLESGTESSLEHRIAVIETSVSNAFAAHQGQLLSEDVHRGAKLDKGSLDRLHRMLAEQTKAVKHLTETISRDAHELDSSQNGR